MTAAVSEAETCTCGHPRSMHGREACVYPGDIDSGQCWCEGMTERQGTAAVSEDGTTRDAIADVIRRHQRSIATGGSDCGDPVAIANAILDGPLSGGREGTAAVSEEGLVTAAEAVAREYRKLRVEAGSPGLDNACAELMRVLFVRDTLAAAPPALLDVDRLAPIIEEMYMRGLDGPEAAAFLAREYATLASSPSE